MAASDKPSLNPKLKEMLQKLRAQLKRYVFIEGISLVIILLCLLFWLSLFLDWGYFKLSRLELPVWFRQAFMIGTVCLFAGSLLTWVVFRTMRSMRTKALALLLERRFPELNDSLITAVEFEDEDLSNQTPLTNHMLERTIKEATHKGGSLNVSSVFDYAPLRKAVLFATVLVVSIGAFWATQASAMDRWKNAFLNWKDEYWSRETQLIVQIVAQPNDQVKTPKDQLYKHPRGADLDILVSVAEGKKVPTDVELYYRKADGRGEADIPMSPVPGNKFRAKVTNLRDNLEFWITGGDYTNRHPYIVQVVEAPQIDELRLQCLYPSYTGLNEEASLKDRLVRGEEIALPVGTRFFMKGKINKPLQGATIESTLFQLQWTQEGGILMVPNTEPGKSITHQLSKESLSHLWGDSTENVNSIDNGKKNAAGTSASSTFTQWSVPMLLTTAEDARERLQNYDPASGDPIPVPSDLQDRLRIYLHDTDDISSREPQRLTIRSILDEPPAVDISRRVVRNKITRNAQVPFSGTVTDDYGLTNVFFEFHATALPATTEAEAAAAKEQKSDPKWTSRPFLDGVSGYPKQFQLGPQPDAENGPPVSNPWEAFSVQKEKLEEGQKLTLVITAVDGDDLWGPHKTKSEPFLFDIVSREELLTLIFTDELKLLQQFKELVEKVQRVRDDLYSSQTAVGKILELRDADPDANIEEVTSLHRDVMSVIESGLHDLRTGHGESVGIEQTFRDLLLEMRYNSIVEAAIEERILQVLEPFERINGDQSPNPSDEVDEKLGLFTETDRSMGLLREKHEQVAKEHVDPSPELEATLGKLDRLLFEMNSVLQDIQKLVALHNLANKLQALIDAQEDLKTETQKKQLKGLDIFN